MLTICSIREVLSAVTFASSFFCFSIFFCHCVSFSVFSPSTSRALPCSSSTQLFGALLSMRSRSTVCPNFSIWMSWYFPCSSSMCFRTWFFSFFWAWKSRCSCRWPPFTSLISWWSSSMRDMSRWSPSCVKTTWRSSSAGSRSGASSPSAGASRHCTCERRRAKTISTWFNLRCLSVWNCCISKSVCFCSLSMRRSLSRSVLCVFFSSSTALWISWSASSMSRRFSRSSMTLSYICTSQPWGGPSSSISSSSSSLSMSLSSSSSSSSSSKSSSSPAPFLRLERFTFFL
mmetsp:Transcript_91044/g.246928  ORF Transcript_91044/g.246928 Transcript_91044/m.246928 type:complete len:288 (+) Transcript_91044:320-1183(+)